jgi:hypothetical protein
LDTARLSGSRLLLDETVRTGLASTTRRESEGTRTSQPPLLSTTCAYLSTRSHDHQGSCWALALGSAMDSAVGTAATATCAPPHSSNALVAISTLCQKHMYKAPMPYPHLGPCTSGGMSMTIAPPRGPTQKHCLGPQVLLCDLVYLWLWPLSKPQVCSRWKVNIGLYWDGEPSLNEFWIDKAWELALFDVTGLSRLPCDEGEGA